MNGCFNREPLLDSAIVQDGWVWWSSDVRVPNMVRIKDPMNKDCQYTLSELGQADKKCIGCKWRKENVSSSI